MYGQLVIAYLFLGGASAGASFVMAAWNMAAHRKSSALGRRQKEALKSLVARCYAVCLALLAAALLCLLWSLGSPGKALLLFLQPRPTVLTFGAFSLVALLAVDLLLAASNLFGAPRLGGRAKGACEALCCLFSLFAMIYTGFFLADGGIPFWDTKSLVALFLFSSLSAGVSLVLLIDFFTQGRKILLQTVRPLQKAHVACLVCEAASLAVFLAAAFLNPQAASAVALLTGRDMLATFSVGAIGMGIVLPLALESGALVAGKGRSLPVSDVLCLVGGFLLRFCIVACGQHWSGPLA